MATWEVPTIPQRRRRSLPGDIIDVDSIPDDELPPPAQRRRTGEDSSAPRRPVVITIEESDEDDVVLLDPREPGPSSRRLENIHRPFRVFSPPPPLGDRRVPPVPRIPAHLATHTSFPMRRHPPPDHTRHHASDDRRAYAHVIRPSSRPFILDDIGPAAPVRRGTPPDASALAAAARSHHQPSMGFGGALIREVHRARPPRGEPPPSRIRIFDRMSSWLFGQREGHDAPLVAPTSHDQERNDLLDALALSAALYEPGFTGHSLSAAADRIRKREEAQYNPEWTHPNPKADPGFTFNFDPDEKAPIEIDAGIAGPSSSATSTTGSTTFVCAHCLHPFVIGGSGESNPANRIWGLRCGHVIDGRCMEVLSRPAAALDKGKGKAKTIEEEVTPSETHSKGKGKAHADAEDATFRAPHPRTRSATSATGGPSTPIAGRTRSGAGPSAGTIHIRARAVASRGTGKARGRGRAKGKGKGKQRVPIPTAYFEWACPVAGCYRAHQSVLLEGVWVQDKEDGAIAVYV